LDFKRVLLSRLKAVELFTASPLKGKAFKRKINFLHPDLGPDIKEHLWTPVVTTTLYL